MFYEKPMPFYMAYPVPYLFDQEKEQDRDLQVMKSFYSEKAMQIQELVEQECDRMEYDGSMMYDECPDPGEIHRQALRIQEHIRKEDPDAPEERTDTSRLQDLIETLLFQEMHRRRRRRRRFRRHFIY